ncbi:MAG: LLM class flavin-dependent oxidoreductase [Actinomycetota bacterium]|nr:LLM class flavin-dependent oxidoreductase [Actinomycetota bacterium]
MPRLLFGVNIPSAAGPDSDPAGQARAAERLGFDFVSASDHPGSASPVFENWTMLTWIAAATSRITVMPRVLGVPLRLPALLAKAAEALSRLSDGRLILGLGAGYDDQELASLGLAAGTPGDKLRGLQDAVRIMGGLWRQPGGFSYDGPVYSTRDAHLEPKPARPIPIWLGTFGPRALELTGQVADGWIPSRGYMPDEQIPVMRQRVLDAAQRAGRDPAQITCALNLSVRLASTDHRDADQLEGTPAKIADGLRHYIGLGFTAFNFIVHGDEQTGQVERLANEVLPVITAEHRGARARQREPR